MTLTDQDKQDAFKAMKAVITGIKSSRTGPGYLVKTRHGTGRTFHSDLPVNGKIPVFLDDGRKMLCDPEKLEFLGFVN